MTSVVPRRAALAVLPLASALGASRPIRAEAREAAHFAALQRRYARARADLLAADRRLRAACDAATHYQELVHERQDRLSEIAEEIENHPTATREEAARQAAILADERRVLRGEAAS